MFCYKPYKTNFKNAQPELRWFFIKIYYYFRQKSTARELRTLQAIGSPLKQFKSGTVMVPISPN